MNGIPLLLEQVESIQRLATRLAELGAILGKPRKTSSNSYTPPSQDGPGGPSSWRGNACGELVALEVVGDHKPDVWISDCSGGQHQLGHSYQVCLAHVLRDVPYVID